MKTIEPLQRDNNTNSANEEVLLKNDTQNNLTSSFDDFVKYDQLSKSKIKSEEHPSITLDPQIISKKDLEKNFDYFNIFYYLGVLFIILLNIFPFIITITASNGGEFSQIMSCLIFVVSLGLIFKKEWARYITRIALIANIMITSYFMMFGLGFNVFLIHDILLISMVVFLSLPRVKNLCS